MQALDILRIRHVDQRDRRRDENDRDQHRVRERMPVRPLVDDHAQLVCAEREDQREQRATRKVNPDLVNVGKRRRLCVHLPDPRDNPFSTSAVTAMVRTTLTRSAAPIATAWAFRCGQNITTPTAAGTNSSPKCWLNTVATSSSGAFTPLRRARKPSSRIRPTTGPGINGKKKCVISSPSPWKRRICTRPGIMTRESSCRSRYGLNPEDRFFGIRLRPAMIPGPTTARSKTPCPSSAAAGRFGFGLPCWNTARAPLPVTRLLGQGDAARAFSLARGLLAVDGNAAERVERFPGDALRVRDPVFVRLGVAARRSGLVERRDVGLRHVLAQLFQLLVGFHLEPQMAHPGRMSAPGNGEVDPRIVQHPLGVIGFLDGRRRAKEAAVKTHALRQIADGNVNMESLHVTFSFRLRVTGLRAGAQVSPPQQFSIK